MSNEYLEGKYSNRFVFTDQSELDPDKEVICIDDIEGRLHLKFVQTEEIYVKWHKMKRN